MRIQSLLFLLVCFSITNISVAQKSLGLYFNPDYRFEGSALTKWAPTGNVKWSAQNGEITAATTPNGGLLQMDRSFQDVVIQLLVKCAPDDEAGVLFRLEKIPEGMKAVLISLKDSSVNTYNVQFDAQGKMLRHTRRTVRHPYSLFWKQLGPVIPSPGAVPAGYFSKLVRTAAEEWVRGTAGKS